MITSLDPADSGRRGKTNILRKGFDVKADIFSNKKALAGLMWKKTIVPYFQAISSAFFFSNSSSVIIPMSLAFLSCFNLAEKANSFSISAAFA